MSASASPSSRLWRRRAKPLFGTRVEVALRTRDAAEFESASERVFERLAGYQRAMSFHDAGSDLHAIARARAGERLRVAAETHAVLAAALALEHESNGLFNCAIAPRLVCGGQLPAPCALPPLLSASAHDAIRLEADGSVTVLRAVWIDLGGIAKGAAVDAALATARALGIEAARVNAGGDIAVYGVDDQPIEVLAPGRRRVFVGTLGEGAIATSGPFAPDERDDLVYARGVEPRWADRSVSVIAPRCIDADALTKLVLALGADAAPWLAARGAQALAIDRDGRIERVAVH